MESLTNQEIREILEAYGIKHDEVKEINGAKYNLIGHLKMVANNHSQREIEERATLASSLGVVAIKL